MTTHPDNRDKMESAASSEIAPGDSFLTIIDKCNLSKIEIMALMTVMSHMVSENGLDVTQADIMREIGSNPSNATRVFKKLRDTGAIIKENGRIFVNPHIMRAADEMGRSMMNAIIMGSAAMRNAKTKIA